MRNFLFCIIVIGCICACSGNAKNKQVKYTPSLTAIPSNSVLNLKLPAATIVPFRGEVSFDNAGQNTGGFLYPAPNAGGFLVAIATHAAISSSINNSQKTSFQEKADKVLDPYKSIISHYSYRELADSSLKKLGSNKDGLIISQTDRVDHPWTIESSPIFILSQNKDSLVLQNAVTVYAAEKPNSVIYKNMIQVISSPMKSADSERYWSDDDGANLKNTSSELFSDSLKIALTEMRKESTTEEGAYTTFRYNEGKHEKLERAQLIAVACKRIIIRTLRGWVMSVPAKDDTGCHSDI